MTIERDWRFYRSAPELALVDDLDRRLRANLGNSDGQFFYVTLSPHRSESSHLSDYDRQCGSAKSASVHERLARRGICLYRRWNNLFFKRPSAAIGSHFPMLLCIDDPLAKTGGIFPEATNGPHIHMIVGLQPKHVPRWQKMRKAGHLQSDAEKLFPRGDLNVEDRPRSDIPRTISYSMKYEFQGKSETLLWRFFENRNPLNTDHT